MPTAMPSNGPLTVVLLSGGLDSAVLLAHEAEGATVLPLYVFSGLAWEGLELAMVEHLLGSGPAAGRVLPLMRVEFTVHDVYAPSHWALRGDPPSYDTPDDEVYLAGRNLVLLSKAGIVAALKGAHRIALGPLAGNPFPDARPSFFHAMQHALSLGLDHPVEVATPFLAWTKADVIRRGRELRVPLDLTLSCMNPLAPASPGEVPLHCGRCSKCRERRDAFGRLGLDDPAAYASEPPLALEPD
jgi:7-cyano-7-deazaguanine synthase